MAILHKNISAEGDIHNPKWFSGANNGDVAWRNELGVLESTDELVLPAALDFVDGSAAPPTSNSGDIYVLSSGASVNAGWGTVALGDWVRYDGTTWNVITPQKSSLCYNETTDALNSYDGSIWSAIGSGGGGGNTIYTADDTIGAGRVATLTDTLRFKNGIVEVQGIGTTGSSALAIYDGQGTPVKLWDFLDNGNIELLVDSTIDLGSSALTFEGNTVGGITFLSSGRSAFKGGNTSASQICLEAQDGTGSRVFEVRNNGDIHMGASSPTVFLNTDLTIDVPNDLTVDYTGAGNLVTFENSSTSGSKSFVSYGRTVLKGVATSAAQIAMQVDDSADTRVFEVRCNGDIYTNGTQGFTGTGAYTNFTIENGIITNAS